MEERRPRFTDRTNGKASAVSYALIALFSLVGAYWSRYDVDQLFRIDDAIWGAAKVDWISAVGAFLVGAGTAGFVAWRAWRHAPAARFPAAVSLLAMGPLWVLWSLVSDVVWIPLLAGLHLAATFLLFLPPDTPPGPAPEPKVPSPSPDPQPERIPPSTPWVQWVFLGVIGLGVLLRIAAWLWLDIQWDGSTYSMMAHSWTKTGGFIEPYGNLVWADTEPTPSHHYPPGYPIYLGLFFKVLGVGLWQTKLAAFVAGLLCIGVVFLVTRDLYGGNAALAVAAVLSVEPDLILAAGRGFSENLGLMFFAVTMWGIIRSLERPPFILLGGLAAGVAYVTRGSMGIFFIVAGLGGFLWRFYHKRWRVFTDVYYLMAAVLFLGFVAAWAGRNIHHFGLEGWETSTYVTYSTEKAFSDLREFAAALAYKWAFHVFLIGSYWVFFGPWLRAAMRRVREEHTSALWVGVFLLTLLAWIFASIFYIQERHQVFWTDNRRYVAIAFLPLLWLVFRHADPTSKALRRRVFGLMAVLLVISVNLFSGSYQLPLQDAATVLNDRVEPGDVVAYEARANKYAFYAYLPRDDILVVNLGWSPPADYIISGDPTKDYSGFRKIGEWHVDPWMGMAVHAVLWARVERLDTVSTDEDGPFTGAAA